MLPGYHLEAVARSLLAARGHPSLHGALEERVSPLSINKLATHYQAGKRVCLSRDHRSMPQTCDTCYCTDPFPIEPQTGIVALIAISFAMTIQSYLDTRNYHFGFESLASVFEVVTLIMALILTAVENEKTHLPSNVLLVYWLLLAIISGIKFRTLAMGCPVSIIHPAKPEQYPPVALILIGAKFIDAILIFGLECVPREAGIRLGDEDLVSSIEG
jgi:hypothetical protein